MTLLVQKPHPFHGKLRCFSKIEYIIQSFEGTVLLWWASSMSGSRSGDAKLVQNEETRAHCSEHALKVQIWGVEGAVLPKSCKNRQTVCLCSAEQRCAITKMRSLYRSKFRVQAMCRGNGLCNLSHTEHAQWVTPGSKGYVPVRRSHESSPEEWSMWYIQYVRARAQLERWGVFPRWAFVLFFYRVGIWQHSCFHVWLYVGPRMWR